MRKRMLRPECREKKELNKGSFGTAALVCGICGLLFLPIILSTLAIIFGAIAINKQEKYGKAGLILGVIGWAWMVIAFVVLASALASLF